jgi:pseudouridine kinase
VRLLTAYGDDAYGQKVAASCSELGIDLSHGLRLSDCATSTYLYLTDETGEMALAVSDMEVCKRITPAYLASNLNIIHNAQLVVADANIPEESLVYLAENCTAPFFVDPVSTVKAEKLRTILPKIHTLKPNRLEAELLSGVKIENDMDLERATDKLLDMGVHRLFISMGADGVFAAMGDQRVRLPNLPGKMVSTTGCGDAFMAALAWAYLQGMDLRDTALAGLAAGSVAMESMETINPNMSAAALQYRMKKA